MAKLKWRDLPSWARGLIVAAGVVEVVLLAAANIDLARRPAEQVRGPKMCWRLVSLINFFGPLAYFRFGRLPAIADGRPVTAAADPA